MEVRLEGYETWKQRVRVSNETSSVVAPLDPSPAVLQVVTDPPGARISVNAKVIGKSPLPVEGLEVGQTVLVRADKRGYISRSESIEIAKTEDAISIELKRRR